MKKVNKYQKFIMVFIFLLSLVINTILYSQSSKNTNYEKVQIIPNIDDYPPAIRRLEKARVEYFNKKREIEAYGKKEQVPEEYVVNYTRDFISANLYYTSVKDNNSFDDYYIGNKAGIEIWNRIKDLPYPWYFLTNKDGIVLAELICDKEAPSTSSNHAAKVWKKPPPSPFFKYLLKAKVVDDIFGTIEEDTILVRHNHYIPKEENFNKDENVKILLTLSSGYDTIRGSDEGKSCYLTRKPGEFMYVINEEIKNPYTDLPLEGVKYQEFKQNLLEFVKKEGIRPWR